MLAEGAGTTAQCFMVAHRRDRPREMHAILLEPCGSTVLGDLIANVNFPGDFDLRGKPRMNPLKHFLPFVLAFGSCWASINDVRLRALSTLPFPS